MDFADRLEKATVQTIEEGEMTKDLALITSLPDPKVLKQPRLYSGDPPPDGRIGKKTMPEFYSRASSF